MPDVNTEKKDVTTFSLKDDPTFKQMVSIIAALGTNLKEIQKQNQELVGRFESFKEAPRQRLEETPAETQPEDLNAMDQATLVKHILSQVSKTLDTAVSPVRRDLTGLSDRLAETSIRSDLKEFASRHPDVVEYGDELKTIFDETPGLSIDKAYKLVKLEFPDKAKIVDEKYHPTKDETKGRPFGGLTPTSGMTPGGEDKKMTPAQASDKAWEETIAQFPNLAGQTE